MKTLLLVIAFVLVLVSSTARADDASGILAALNNPEGALADILRPEADSTLATLGEKVDDLQVEIRMTRSIEVPLTAGGPLVANAGRTINLLK